MRKFFQMVYLGNRKFLWIDNFREVNRKKGASCTFLHTDYNFSAISQHSIDLYSTLLSKTVLEENKYVCNKTNDETIFLHNNPSSLLPLKSECRIQVCLTVTKDWCSSFSFEWSIRTYSWFFNSFVYYGQFWTKTVQNFW